MQRELSDYQRAALGFGTKAVWPLTRGVPTRQHRRRLPGDAARRHPPWAADPERLDATQERANTQARQFWQRAAWTRSANITNVETDRATAR